MTRSWRRWSSAVALAAAALAAAAGAGAEVVDRIVAVVNDEIVLLSELGRQAAPYEERAMAEAPDPVGRALARSEVRAKVLDGMIADRLVEEQARELGVQVSQKEIDAEIGRLKKENGLDESEFKRQMARQGFTDASLRDYLRKSRQRQKVIEARVQPRVAISDTEIRAYYQANFQNDDEVRVRMISKRIPQAASRAETERVRSGLEAIRVQVTTGGKEFAAIARVETEGPNPGQGGDLGWFARGDVAPEIERAAFALAAGQVGPVIEFGGAFHLLQVVERRERPAKPFEEVQDRIRALLFNQAAEKEYERWVAELRSKAFVEVRLDGPVAVEAPAPPSVPAPPVAPSTPAPPPSP